MPVVLCGCKTWSYTLRGEAILRVFKNGVQRKTCGSEMKEVNGSWRKLPNEDLHIIFIPYHILLVNKSRSKR